MAKLFTTLFLLFLSLGTQAQAITSSELHSLTLVSGKAPAETAVSIGKQFIGKPYIAHTLDQNPTEQLVVNLREFDCTTYLETVLALTLAWHDVADKPNPAITEQTFRNYLTKLRYRTGRIDGYASRLHYFSDWLRDNERKGLLLDVSHELPGNLTVAKPISYMTTATYKYPHLRDPAIFNQVALTEASLSQQSFSFIPAKNIRQAEDQLHEGDIIMLITARPGLDMKHVGLAVRQPDGRMHLLHASSDMGMVVITPYPISDYVLWHKRLSGIRVARLRQGGVLSTAIVQGN
ncbi:N-acetylmuramoyl-L-alanine amidase-like domain-containing protein [Spirosoma flavum]|uniref:N-acetylmuramoyl-L-alanine amidase-like domain-containing protein n=1 Tax=Spirosoma flavum TaxID=2048557 RepID=A0ABW6ADG7_9BACT